MVTTNKSPLPLLPLLCLFFLTLPSIALSEVVYSVSSPIKNQASFDKIGQKGDSLVVYMLPMALEFSYFYLIDKGIQSVAKQHNIDYSMVAPQVYDPELQHQILADIVQQNRADAILFSSLDPSLNKDLLKKASNQGMVVIEINSDKVDFPVPIHAVVGYKQRSGTFNMGQWLAQKTHGRPTKVGIISGSPGYHNDERIGGFTSGAKEAENISVVGSENGAYNTKESFYATQKLLKKQPDIGAIFAVNDNSIIGASLALAQMGRSEVILMGVDGDPAIIPRIDSGEISATVETNPYLIGQVAIQIVLDSINGHFSGGYVEIPSTILNSSNITKSRYYKPLGSIQDIESITLAVEGREGFISSDGKGFYADILHEIFKPAGINVRYAILPLKRGQSALINNKVDGMIGIHNIPGGIYNRTQWHLDVDTIAVTFLKSKHHWRGQSTLRNRSVSWVRGTDYSEYIYPPFELHETNNILSALKMVQLQRVDFSLGLRSAIEKEMSNLDRQKFQLNDIIKLRNFVTFTDTPRGSVLKKYFDDRFASLLFSGQLKPIFERWDKVYTFPQ